MSPDLQEILYGKIYNIQRFYSNFWYLKKHYEGVSETSVTFLNPFNVTGLFLYPLKTSEKQKLFHGFRGYRKIPIAWNGLRVCKDSKVPGEWDKLKAYLTHTRPLQFGAIYKVWKTWQNSHGGVLLLVKLQALACNLTKSNTRSWVFFTFFKLYKWYQIVQSFLWKHIYFPGR